MKPSPILRLLNALGDADCRPRRSGAGYSARCPAHDDAKPSLSVSEGDDGRVLIHCQAGCAARGRAGRPPASPRPTCSRPGATKPRPRSSPPTTTSTRPARLLFQVVRYAPKDFRQRRPDGTGGWVWDLKGVPAGPVPAARGPRGRGGGRTVFVAEGEKDVDALRVAGEVATCNPMGAGKWRPEHAQVLYGAAEVVIVAADADEPGRAHAQAVAASLAGHVGHVVIVEADHRQGRRRPSRRRARRRRAYASPMTTPSPRGRPCPPPSCSRRSCGVLRRFIVWHSLEQVDFVALWVLHTYVFGLFDTTPYLDVSSAAKRSGKTRLTSRSWPCSSPGPGPVVEASEAVLFRKVDKERPTLLVDEIDATFGKDSKVTEGLRAIYNAGYRVGAKVPRCVGNNHEPTDFEVYCPKAFAGLERSARHREGPLRADRAAPRGPDTNRNRSGCACPRCAPSSNRWPPGCAAGRRRSPMRYATPTPAARGALRPGPGRLRSPRRHRRPGRRRVAGAGPAKPSLRSWAASRTPTKACCCSPTAATPSPAPSGSPPPTCCAALVNRGDDSPWARWWGKDVEEGRDQRAGVAAGPPA